MAKDKNITVLEDFSFDAPKTKQYLEMLANFELNGKKTLLILNEPNQNIYLSARNLDRTNVTTSANLNTYQILNAGNILMVESSVKEIENTLS
jgi:large subunit ribosomal protein L4